jgi:hypothetical protein
VLVGLGWAPAQQFTSRSLNGTSLTLTGSAHMHDSLVNWHFVAALVTRLKVSDGLPSKNLGRKLVPSVTANDISHGPDS